MPMSGPPVKRFREGWGLIGWGKVHYWRRAGVGAVMSLCGVTTMAGWILEPGTSQVCKLCEKATRRTAPSGSGK